MGTDEAMASAPRFMDLLRQLADEHHREVQELNNEVARLQQVCDEMTFNSLTSTRQQPVSTTVSTDPDVDEEQPDEGALTAAFFVAKEVHKAQKQNRREDSKTEQPDKAALDTALGLASLGERDASDSPGQASNERQDALPLREVDDSIPADDSPIQTVQRHSTLGLGQTASIRSRVSFEPAGDDGDESGSFDIEKSTTSQSGMRPARAGFLKSSSSTTDSLIFWSNGVLEGWRALIHAAQMKQHVAALPTLNDAWKKMAEEEGQGPRQGMFQLDMLVARATHMQTSSAIDDLNFTALTRRKNRLNEKLQRLYKESVLHPTSPQRVCWDVLGISLLVHDLVFIPMQVFDTGTEGLPSEYLDFQVVFDKICASFWSIDIGVSFRTGFYSAEGFVELRPGPVAQHYMKSWLPMDLIIVCTDWVTMFLGMSSAAGFMRLGKSISRFMRVIRLLRFLKLNRALKEITERINSEYMLQVMGIFKTLALIIILNHYIACAWFGLGSMGLDSRWPDKFLVNYPESFGYAYTTSLHWSLTQFTPASMEVVPQNPMERFFVIGVIIIALVAFSSFVSSITAAMTHIRTINAQKVKMEATIRQFFSEHKISHAMASRVWHFLKKNRVGTKKRLREMDIPALNVLPEKIKEDLRLEIFFPIITVHPLLAEYGKREQNAMLKICNVALEEKSMPVGEELWRDVNEVHKMLFVLQGKLAYYESSTPLSMDERGEEEDLWEVTVGQWACEICLWANKALLPGAFMALTGGAELVLLNADRFQEIVRGYDASIPFLVKYANFFMTGFQSASTEWQQSPPQSWSQADVLFNLSSRIEEYVGLATGARRKSAPKGGRRTAYKSFISTTSDRGGRSSSTSEQSAAW